MYHVSVFARTDCIKEAYQLLGLFSWGKYLTYKEIYPTEKTKHFRRLVCMSQLELGGYQNFFDTRHSI